MLASIAVAFASGALLQHGLSVFAGKLTGALNPINPKLETGYVAVRNQHNVQDHRCGKLVANML